MPATLPRPRRRLALLLLPAVAACSASRVPPAVRPLAAPLPLTVLVCSATDPDRPAPLGADGAVFARVVVGEHGGVRPDLVAHVRTAEPTRDLHETSAGLFLWTLGIVPLVQHADRRTTVELRRPAAGPDACAAPDAPPLALATTPRETTVSGWVALLLRPTPWWSEADGARPHPDGKLTRRAHAEVARLVEQRRGEIMALAGR